MLKIKFTTGTLQRIDSDYFDLILYNAGAIAYKATIEANEAAILINKYNNQKIKLISCNK